jgi:hypothetical protein
MFNVMRDVYTHSIPTTAAHADLPSGTLKVGLRAHQQAVLQRMADHEQQLLSGMDCSGARLFSNYGILGDSVGAGKSLMILGHIARLSTLPPLKSYSTLGSGGSRNTFSITQQSYKDISEAGCLIIVPHTLFRQWAGYIKTQTNLSAMLLDKASSFQAENFARDIMAAQVVLVSNTLYKTLSAWTHEHTIRWTRAFIDEADTIHLVSTCVTPVARFTWLVTASWMNLLFPNTSHHLSTISLNSLVISKGAPYSGLRSHFEGAIGKGPNAHYNFFHWAVTSSNFLRNILDDSNTLRGRLVVRCTDDFIKESISLPILHRRVVLCKQAIAQQIVSSVVSAEVAELLHAGDISGAIAALGVKSETELTLVEAVTKNLKKELERLRATRTFKASMEYATAGAKEAALATLDQKIKQAEESIKSVEERIQAADESCPICYDDVQDPLVTPCCSRGFCAQCILTCLARQAACPMCRAAIAPNKLVKVLRASAASTDQNAIVSAGEEGPPGTLPKKHEALMQIFKENPEGRFLVFSRYDNPFIEVEQRLASLGMKVRQLKGNKDAIAATLRGFQGGDTRCLLLNAHHAGSGLNITAATHVILLHAMTHEEEKQILGRAYRMGRTEPLHFIKLLHESEQASTN